MQQTSLPINGSVDKTINGQSQNKKFSLLTTPFFIQLEPQEKTSFDEYEK